MLKSSKIQKIQRFNCAKGSEEGSKVQKVERFKGS